ncbi:MAG TPA: hypothetical protein VMZ27_03790 [Candidatus Saccharimonadales bacterium]|nr:hypothetical protein [Candidatus Saccharimonadales bacterium]
MNDPFTIVPGRPESACRHNQEMPRSAIQCSVHPHILLAHWEIYFRACDWEAALAVAEALVVHLPDETIGWIYRSFALQQMKWIDEGRELSPPTSTFTEDWRLALNRACHCSQLGDIPGAWSWLDRAIQIGDVEQIKIEALAEPALETLWSRL